MMSELETWHHAKIPFNVTKDQLDEASKTFLNVLEIPKLDELIPTTPHPEDHRSNIGYRDRRKEKNKEGANRKDGKQFIHYHPTLFKKYFGHSLRHPTINKFVKHADKLYEESEKMFISFLKSCETKWPGIKRKFFQKGRTPRTYLRFLAYDFKDPYDRSAKGHYDRGPISFPLQESHPGLYVGPKQTRVHVEQRDGHALFMPGIAIEELTNHEMGPSWHGVIHQNSPDIRPGIGRWAIIFFADALGQRHVSFEEAHKH